MTQGGSASLEPWRFNPGLDYETPFGTPTNLISQLAQLAAQEDPTRPSLASANASDSEGEVTEPAAGGQFHPEEYQNLFHEAHWQQMKARPFLWCKFIWNLFDFAADVRNEGDSPGRNDKGLVTYDRQVRKDAYYSWRSGPKAAPRCAIR